MRAEAADALVKLVKDRLARAEHEIAGGITGWTFVESYTKKNFEQLGAQVARWAVDLREAAELGWKGDGTPYTWARWAEHGETLGNSAAAYSSYEDDAGLMRAAVDTVKATSETVQAGVVQATEVVNIGSWGTSTKLIVVLALIAWLVGKFR